MASDHEEIEGVVMVGPFSDYVRRKFGVDLSHVEISFIPEKEEPPDIPEKYFQNWEVRSIGGKCFMCKEGDPDPDLSHAEISSLSEQKESLDIPETCSRTNDPDSILPPVDESISEHVEDIADGITRAQVDDYIRMDHRVCPDRAILHKFNQLLDAKWKKTIDSYISFRDYGCVYGPPHPATWHVSESAFGGHCTLPTLLQLRISGNGVMDAITY